MAADGAGPRVEVEGIRIAWQPDKGVCTFEGLPVAMMWVDTTLAGLMAGVQAMVGTERFVLALQAEGRKSVEADWQIISACDGFPAGFRAIAQIAGVAGWGRWELVSLDEAARRAEFRCWDSWEGRYQQTLGEVWGSGMLAGKLAGYCTRLFGENCWAEQTHFVARGDAFDGFAVGPSTRSLEREISRMRVADQATAADMAVALQALRDEVARRQKAEQALREAGQRLEDRVAERTAELARANEHLVASERRYRSVYDASPMGIHSYRLEPDGRLLFTGANPVAEAGLGFDHEPLIGLPVEEAFPGLAGTDLPERYREVVRTGQTWTSSHIDYEDDRIAGAFEVYAFQTGPAQLSVMFLEITERLKAEQDRAELAAALHRSRKMEALGLLAGGVAHDLNNILSGIVSYPDVLLSEVPPDSDLVEPLEVIRESGRRAAAVVRDLLTIARGAATTRRVRDVNGIVRDYLDSAELDVLRDAMPGVHFDAELDPELLPVTCSPVQVRKVVMNLVTNAAEAIEAGEGEVRITTRNIYVDRPLPGHDAVAIGEYVLLSVSDTGVGIGAADLERIFEPFYTKKVMGRSGTGLGLAVVWSTVQDHDGFVDVESGPGGTRFDVYLPATRAAVERPGQARRLEELLGHGERVLVIDDELGQRQIAARMLTRLGYVVETAATGEEALAVVGERAPDLLVLDMVMPQGWSGRETFERILAVRPGQRALIVSGYAETADVQAIQRLGAGPFLRKPYSLEGVGVAVRKVLDAARPDPG